MKHKHLLIDAKNMLYRAVYVGAYDKAFQKSGHHTINIILHFLNSYLNKFNPEQFHIFWDSPRDQTWRKKILSSYKDGRGGNPKLLDSELNNSINNLTEIGVELFKSMGFRQYYREFMEADDLIYAFCKINCQDNIIIISSDNDLKQITYSNPNVKIHSHLSKTKAIYESIPTLNPIIMKCLVGDKSDNIEGYYLVGPKRAVPLVEDAEKRFEFFNSDKALAKVNGEVQIVGDKRFEDNLKLIDLSLNPYLEDNLNYISKKQSKPIGFDLKAIHHLISKYKLRGVTADISRYISPFKRLAEATDGRNSLR